MSGYPQTACDVCGQSGSYTNGSRHTFNACGGTYRDDTFRLLHAAPELLAALRDALALLDAHKHYTPLHLTQALARAEGMGGVDA